jgi:hypothetical protein
MSFGDPPDKRGTVARRWRSGKSFLRCTKMPILAVGRPFRKTLIPDTTKGSDPLGVRHGKCLSMARSGGFAAAFQPREVAMRALGISLIAIAAVAVSLTVARQGRSDHPLPAEPDPTPDGVPLALELNLEAIRAAGL